MRPASLLAQSLRRLLQTCRTGTVCISAPGTLRFSSQQAANCAPTIFALSTHAGRAAVAIVRISGQNSDAALSALTRKPLHHLPAPRLLSKQKLWHPDTGELLDQGMVVRFKAPLTFTGEDVAELHLHGGNAVVSAVLSALATQPMLQQAQAGEFTKRAFLAGKMDLTEVEGFADLLAADTEQQRKLALQNASGQLNLACQAWRKELLNCMAHLEAVIDFGDDEALSDSVAQRVHGRVALLAGSLKKHLDRGHQGELVRDGIQVAIIGAPNAGKSSLLNFLSQREAAIVSPVAGTTRDVVAVALDLGGYKVEVLDTAGLRSGGDLIEAEGMRRAVLAARNASIVLVMVDSSEHPSDRSAHLRSCLDSLAADIGTTTRSQQIITVYNKTDLLDAEGQMQLAAGDKSDGVEEVHVSLAGGQHVDKLMDALQGAVARLMQSPNAQEEHSRILVTRERHRVLLADCQAALERYSEVQDQHELAAEELRHAAHALGKLSGNIDPEAVLDVLFAEFCIGK